MTHCVSLPQTCLLGPPPPRTPGRADPQVPIAGFNPRARYGRISHLYFYATGRADDAAFGFLDIEFALYPAARGQACFELYCIGDGFQSGAGSGHEHPLQVELRAQTRTVARIAWAYPVVLEGHADPIHFSTAFPLTERDFALIDTIYLPAAKGASHGVA